MSEFGLLENPGLFLGHNRPTLFDEVNNNPLSVDIRDYSMADYTYEVILDRIKEFEEGLDEDHEVALRLASFGQAITLSVIDIGYSNPSTLVFHGFVGDQHATLIQHVSQLNFLLLAVKKADPTKPARRIGFALDPDSAD